jgi:hypothetical protein
MASVKRKCPPDRGLAGGQRSVIDKRDLGRPPDEVPIANEKRVHALTLHMWRVETRALAVKENDATKVQRFVLHLHFS